jgi:hypothetical protein
MITKYIGREAPTQIEHWDIGHGDLHWANVTAPQFMLLDWEHWGLWPRGYDIGRLLGCSAFDSALVARIADVFSREFKSSSSCVGMLAGIASVIWHIDLGELDSSASEPLQAVVHRVLRAHQKSSRRSAVRRWLARPFN